MIDGQIRVLDETVVGRIAAAEAVSRPASVVKELIENSMDAGAKTIEVRVENGGKSLITVLDDGQGMGPDDLLMSVRRHATSKISSVNDLADISTMGFRGEALASVAAVSDLVISSGQGGDAFQMSDGKLRPCPSIRGTRVQVRNLFAAVPARLRFLKSDRAETLAIMDVVRTAAMQRPDIRFILEDGCRQVLKFMQTGDKERLADVMGPAFVKDSHEVFSNTRNLKVSGFISVPSASKGAATDQLLFVNGRAIRDASLTAAIREGYGSRLSSLRHPSFMLKIEVPGTLVEVNSHPSKASIRFHRPDELCEFISGAVENALGPKPPSPVKSSSSPDLVLTDKSGPIILADRWEVFLAPDGEVKLVDRKVSAEQLLSSSRSVDLAVPIVFTDNRPAETINQLATMGITASSFGGNAVAIEAVPDACAGDPAALSGLLGASPANPVETVKSWIMGSLRKVSLAGAGPALDFPHEHFSRMMGRAR